MSKSLRLWARAAACAFAAGCALASAAPPALPAGDTWHVSSATTAPLPVHASGQLLTLPFPRLAIMFPTRVKAPLESVARFDWVRLSVFDAPLVPSLKAMNPNLMALPYIDSCEVPYNPSADASPQDNEVLRGIPAQWLLTQVGASLTEDVSASAMSMHVDRASAVIDGKTVMLFAPGDSVVIEGEIAYVESVDPTNLVLGVRRGYIHQAVPHAAGTRVAATITDAPQSLVLDASTFCPENTVDPAVGPETWGEYEARMVAGIVAGSQWDGVYLDRCEPNQSWLVNGSTVRTIDPNRSNAPVSDYSEFNAAWANGIRLFHSRVRTLLGDHRIILANCAMPNYDLLNGDVFENFPDQSGTWYYTPWNKAVLGPSALFGSYFEWMANARQPNLTTILTYEKDGRPSLDDPASLPGFVPNYRKMRFGLCTALLNDGFFSYSIHSSDQDPLLWFDEYDNAGRGGGYLGPAVGSARRAVGEAATPNLVSSGGFDTAADVSNWFLDQGVGYRGAAALDAGDKTAGVGSVRIDITEAGGVGWSLPFMLMQPMRFTQGAEYTLSFWAKADRPRTARPWVHRQTTPAGTLMDFGDQTLTTSWQHFEVSGTAAQEGATGAVNGGLIFALGQSQGSVWLDDVEVQRGGSDVWRRDFQGGVSLVNASTSRVTVPLDGVLRKINGTQAPAINDGSLVARVTLRPRDGLILLRPTASPREVALQAASQAAQHWRRCASLSQLARDYYVKLARHCSGAERRRAARSRLSWQRVLTAARIVRAEISACSAALASGDAASASSAARAARVAASRASSLIARVVPCGHVGRSFVAAERSSAAAGRESLFTARAAAAVLP